MIKKTYRKNIFREVKSTMNRFIAIFAITALGAGFFAGLKATGGDMRNTATTYYADQKLMDFQLVSTMGFTEDDITALRELSEVKEVMPSYSMDLILQANAEAEETVKIFGLPADTSSDNAEYLNQLVVLDGRLPENATECVVDSFGSRYKVGDTFTVSDKNNTDTTDLLAEKSFTVVGVVESPYYISTSRGNTNIGDGTISMFMYLPASSFDSEYYTTVFVTVNDTENLAAYSDEYTDVISAGNTKLESFATDRAKIRYDDILKDGNEQLDEARQTLADAKVDANTQLDEAAQTIADSEKEIADGKKEIAENQKKLDDAQAELASGATELANARTQLENGQAQYDSNLVTFNQKKAEYETANAQLQTSKAGVAQLQSTLDTISPLPDQIAALDQGIAGLELLEAAGVITPTEQEQLDTLRGQRTQALDGFNAGISGIAAGLTSFADGLNAQGDSDNANLLRTAATQAEALAQLGDTTSQNTAIAILGQSISSLQTQFDALQAQMNDASAQINSGQQALSDAKATLDSGWSQLTAGESELASARTTVANGQKELASARATLARGENELLEGKAEYESKKAEAEQKFADAEAEIAENQQKLDDVEEPTWYVTDRTSNPGYSGLEGDSSRIDAIAQVFPVFFFLVAALVCLTTMTRMVEDQRTQIGTLKALGFTKSSIAFKYIFYAGAASLTGSIVGVLLGFLVFPSTIWSAYQIMYMMPSVVRANHTGLAISGIIASVLCTTLATVWACFNELRSVPAELMRPKAPKPGKRVLLERFPAIWKRISFSNKLTIRNLFRYKKRFFMTIIGVAGCTALLVTGFGLRDSITGIADQQYGVLNTYDMMIYTSDASSIDADTPLNTKLKELGDSNYISQDAVTVKFGNANSTGMTVDAYTFENMDDIDPFVHFQDRKTKEVVAPPTDDGVVITEKLATKLGISVGDTIEVGRTDVDTVGVTVSGITENYLLNYVYMTPTMYQEVLGKAPEYKTVLLALQDDSQENITATLPLLVDTDGVLSAVSIESLTGQVDDMLGSLNKVLWVIVLAAALLAIVVLYNLTNINITERAREIATLKVLGFYDKEVSSYVFKENFILTLISVVVGLVLGVFLHRFVITTAEVDEVMFRRTVEPLSYLLAAVFTVLANVVVSFVMMPKLKKIDMIESLKSAE